MTFSPDYVFVIGVGGTGGYISSPLARLVAYHPSTKDAKVVFIDGDEFEESNMTRQIVGEAQLGLNKARAMMDFCSYQGLSNVDYKDDYISMTSFIPLLRRSNCPMIVCSVDNDATRKDIIAAISSACEDKDFFFITPGNSDGTETVKGQTLWFGRVGGQSIGLNPSLVYPNIENPEDSVPHKGSCATQAPSRPQLISANFMAAAITLSVIQNVLDEMINPQQSGMFFNLRTLTTSVS
jgi:tRNA A37 threonylcarbamoyladenosine dehydratase